MTKEVLQDLLEAIDLAIYSGDWRVDGACDPDAAIQRAREALAQPDPYKQGYADAMNWKVQNHLEHLPAAQKLADWKLVPIEPTREMLEEMDECSMEGYDERLYAGHAASVYMAAVDVAPTPPQQCYCGDITRLGVVHRADSFCDEKPQPKEPEQSTTCGEPVALEALKWIARHDLSGADDRAIALMAYAFVSKARFAVLEATGERA